MLGEGGIISRDLAAAMRRCAGLKNLLVHRYGRSTTPDCTES